MIRIKSWFNKYSVNVFSILNLQWNASQKKQEKVGIDCCRFWLKRMRKTFSICWRNCNCLSTMYRWFKGTITEEVRLKVGLILIIVGFVIWDAFVIWLPCCSNSTWPKHSGTLFWWLMILSSLTLFKSITKTIPQDS